MGNANKSFTQVFALPTDEAARARFIEGIRTLAVECNAELLGASTFNEMEYADFLEQKMSERCGDYAVEEFRQQFERGERSEE